MTGTVDVVRCLRQAGQKALARAIELAGSLDGTRATVVEVPDVDGGGVIPAVYYVPTGKSGEIETNYRLLPLDSAVWRVRGVPRISRYDGRRTASGNPDKQLAFRILSLVLAGRAGRSRSFDSPLRMWVSSLLVWRQSASRDGRCAYRCMASGFPGVFADPEQTLRWNSYVSGPVSWDEYRSQLSARHVRHLPCGFVSRSERAAVDYAESLIANWDLSFVIFCRRASPARYSGTTQIIVDWKDVLEGVERKWPEHATLAEMM